MESCMPPTAYGRLRDRTSYWLGEVKNTSPVTGDSLASNCKRNGIFDTGNGVLYVINVRTGDINREFGTSCGGCIFSTGSHSAKVHIGSGDDHMHRLSSTETVELRN